MLAKVTERQTFMTNVPEFDFSSKNKSNWLYLQKLEEQMIMTSTGESLSTTSIQFILALTYIADHVGQEAKNCKDQRSMSWLIFFFFF